MPQVSCLLMKTLCAHSKLLNLAIGNSNDDLGKDVHGAEKILCLFWCAERRLAGLRIVKMSKNKMFVFRISVLLFS